LQREDKKLIFVLFVFVIGISIALIIQSNYFKKSNQAVLFETQSSTIASSDLDLSSDELTKIEVNFPIDLNFATKEELMGIDGIGEKTALKIIEYRNKSGCFNSLEDLLNVDGIGEKTLEKLKSYIYIESSSIVLTTESETTKSSEIKKPIATTSRQTTTKPATTEAKTTKTTKTTTSQTTCTSKIIITTTINYPLDINFASCEELMSLSGIGATRANEIISYRNNIGYFYSIEDIKNVSGIGDGIFSNIKDYIYVETCILPPKKTEMTTTLTTPVTTPPTLSTTTTIPVTTTSAPVLLNINTASLEELSALPQMNASLAQKIIDFRKHTDGGFTELTELLYVLNPSTYSAIIDYITL